VIFDPAMQAYVGDRIPFAQRARAWGIIELSWSGALFIVAPLTGFLLDTASLQAVFLALFMFMIFSIALIWFFIPGDRPAPDAPRTVNLNYLKLVRAHPTMLAALGFTFCIVGGQEIFIINYGLWMQQSFDLEITALGVATIVISLAEVVGEVALSVLGDRVGKWRLALVSAVMTALCFVLLPHTSINLGLALVGIFFLFVFLETAIVASITLFTEVLPTARSMMMSANYSAGSLGRLFGAILGGSLFAWTGSFALIGAVTMGIVLVGCGLMWWLRSVE
jgi:predicted MFS family arabinose efflux permease